MDIRGFTLFEILLVVSAIAILATMVILAINPAYQIAKMHNTQRRADVKTILDAVYQYSVDNEGKTPPGIDSTLRVIGTATSGCDIGCGQRVGMEYPPLESFFERITKSITPVPVAFAEGNSSKVLTKPYIVDAMVDPTKVYIGDSMEITAHVTDMSGIVSVQANMGDIETIPLYLVSGTIYNGIWKNSWTVHSTKPIWYTTTIEAKNLYDTMATYTINWFDPPPSGWVSPTGFSDPGNQWTVEPSAYDNNTGTYASNNYGGSGWGQFIYLTLSAPITSDRVRINADYMNVHIIAADVDVFVDGVWVDVFQGGDEATWNAKWVELPFTKGEVTQARFRYNYRVGGYYYWLYEFQFYQTVPTVTVPACTTQAVTSIQENSVVAHGVVDDDGGEPVQYRFQYGTTVAYGTDTAWAGSAQSTDVFSEVLSSLLTDTTYHFHAQVRNSAGTTDCGDLTFTTGATGSGWVLPTGVIDSSNTWANDTSAYDDALATYASSYHNINAPQWSEYLYFTRVPTHTNKIRFYARGGAEVNTVDVDVFVDDVWVDVYQGAFADKQWVEVGFPEELISQARIRFYATTASSGFFWELYEFNFYKMTEANSSSCVDLNSTLTGSYITSLPHDPTEGDESITYYAVRKNIAGRIIVYSCGAELDENISVTR